MNNIDTMLDKIAKPKIKPTRANQVHRQTKTPNQQPEYQEQCRVIEWALRHQRQYVGLELINCSLNGMKMTPAQAGRAKRAGMKAGIPDLHLPVPNGHYLSLYIEMKAGSNTTTKIQNDVVRKLRGLGHCVAVCYTWQEAVKAIQDYYDFTGLIEGGV